jgi:hypothetical protein
MNENKTFKISDISIAAFLLVKGNTITSIDKNAKGQYFFEFIKTDSIEQESLSFLTSECSRYDNQMRLLRSLLKSK